jgi:hypothetical protein
MYTLVFGVLGGAFLIVFGGVLGYALAVMSFERFWLGDTQVKLWGIPVFLPISTLFLWAGVVTMYSTVCALRGLPPKGKRMPRWISWLNRSYMG